MILAFDPGNNTGYCAYDSDDNIQFGLIKEEKTLQYMEQVAEVYANTRPEMVVIEKPFIGKKFSKSPLDIARCVERIKISILLQYPDAMIEEVSNSEWKKAIIGKGNCKKEETIKFINNKFHLNLKDNNITDAMALSLYGDYLLKNKVRQYADAA